MYLSIFNNTILIIFIIILSITFILFIILVALILRLIKISTKLKAKQFNKFNKFAKENKIVFLGDSLTEFYQIEEFFHDYEVYNRGIASDTTNGVLERLDKNVIEIKPRKVFLQIGTNDFKYKKKNEYILNNIIKIITRLKESNPNMTIYMISLYPINPKAKFYSKFFTNPRKNKNIIDLNQKLEIYCNEENIKYIDVFSHLVDDVGNLKREYTTEGLHINHEGYLKITEILRPYL